MKKLSPRNAKTLGQFCSLKRDNFGTRESWILSEENTVTLCNQKKGESNTAQITIKKSHFNKLIDWYNTEQITKKSPRK
jgi:hypothetical protein